VTSIYAVKEKTGSLLRDYILQRFDCVAHTRAGQLGKRKDVDRNQSGHIAIEIQQAYLALNTRLQCTWATKAQMRAYRLDGGPNTLHAVFQDTGVNQRELNWLLRATRDSARHVSHPQSITYRTPECLCLYGRELKWNSTAWRFPVNTRKLPVTTTQRSRLDCVLFCPHLGHLVRRSVSGLDTICTLRACAHARV
jgi:hypothetical protein